MDVKLFTKTLTLNSMVASYIWILQVAGWNLSQIQCMHSIVNRTAVLFFANCPVKWRCWRFIWNALMIDLNCTSRQAKSRPVEQCQCGMNLSQLWATFGADSVPSIIQWWQIQRQRQIQILLSSGSSAMWEECFTVMGKIWSRQCVFCNTVMTNTNTKTNTNTVEPQW